MRHQNTPLRQQALIGLVDFSKPAGPDPWQLPGVTPLDTAVLSRFDAGDRYNTYIAAAKSSLMKMRPISFPTAACRHVDCISCGSRWKEQRNGNNTMSRILTKHSLTHCGLLAVVLASLSFSSNLVGEQPNLNRPYAEWATDYDTAVEQSRRTGRPIMLSFTRSDRCDTCNKLSTEIYRSHEFARWSTRHVIKLEVDFPKTYSLPDRIRKQNEQLRKLFGHHVDKLPTVLFVTADGQLIGKTGYMDGGPEIWIEHAATIVRPRPSSDLVARSFYSVRK